MTWRGLRFQSVRARLFATVVLTSLSALAVTGAALLVYDLRTHREAAQSELTAQAELIGQASAAALQFDDVKFAESNLLVLKARPIVRAAALYTSRGALFASYVREGIARGDALPSLPEADGLRLEENRISIFRRVLRDREIVGTVFLESDFHTGKRIAGYAAIAGAAALGALGVALAFSWWLQGGITGPISEVSQLARHVVEQRDYSLRAKRTTEDEIGTFVDAFNAMLAEIERRTGELERSKGDLEREVGERREAERAVRISETRILALNAELESKVSDRTAELRETNKQLEAFSYSVSHDLRAPLRAIDGFSQALVEDCADNMDEQGRRHLSRIRSATLRMSQLIDDLLSLARISRTEVAWKDVDLSAIARQVLAELAQNEPGRKVEAVVWDDVAARGDPRLLRIALENLLGNAWKFTGKMDPARIEFGALRDSRSQTYFVRDNGAGFDMAHFDQLFSPFQRLHSASEFPGTGIGLVTVQRIFHKHGGRVWAHAQPGKGATFYFTTEATPGPSTLDQPVAAASAD